MADPWYGMRVRTHIEDSSLRQKVMAALSSLKFREIAFRTETELPDGFRLELHEQKITVFYTEVRLN